MKIARAIATCSLAGIALAGCSAQAAPDDSRVAGSMSVEQLELYTPNIQSINPIDDSVDAVNDCHRPEGSGVMMSFDDYGTPEQIHTLLRELKELNWQAAFFPTLEWAKDNRSLIVEMQKDGHLVGSHTWTHQDLGELVAAGNEKELAQELKPLDGVENTDPMLLRPPYGGGMDKPDVLKKIADHGYQVCGWTADSNDWRGGTAEEMLKRVMDGYEYSPEPLTPDGVVLSHMHGEHTAEFVEVLAAELDKRGWKRAPLHK